jgi:hypothetical protein
MFKSTIQNLNWGIKYIHIAVFRFFKILDELKWENAWVIAYG